MNGCFSVSLELVNKENKKNCLKYRELAHFCGKMGASLMPGTPAHFAN